MGQCTLARTKHQFVIGVCGYRGSLDPSWDNDTKAVINWPEQAGISQYFEPLVDSASDEIVSPLLNITFHL